MALPSVNPDAASARAGMKAARPGEGPRWRRLAPLGWAAAVLVLSRVPSCVRTAPVLGVLRGPLAPVLLAIATIAVVAGAAAGADRSGRLALLAARARPRALFAVAWAALLVLGLFYTTRLRVSGDEPHYLLMAQSLWREGDLDLRDNLEREDWREYTPGPITPHFAAPRADGRPFPAHSPGLPLLLAPLYALGGRPLCIAALTLLAAMLSVEIWRAARQA